MIKKGIPPYKILIESQSRTTYENIKLSMDKIADENFSKKIGIVTNDYHIFRTISISKHSFGISAFGIPVYSSGILLPHYILREIITYSLDTLMGHI